MSWGRVGILELVVGGRRVGLLGCTSRRRRTGWRAGQGGVTEGFLLELDFTSARFRVSLFSLA